MERGVCRGQEKSGQITQVSGVEDKFDTTGENRWRPGIRKIVDEYQMGES